MTAPLSLRVDSQLMQDHLQSEGILLDLDAKPSVGTLLDAAGNAEAVVVGLDGTVSHVCREPASDSGWNYFGLGAAFGSVAAVDAATVLALGVTDGGRTLWRGDGGRWSTTTPALAGGTPPAALSVGRDRTVWAVDGAGGLYVQGSAPTQSAPSLSPATPATCLDAAGLGHLFVLDTAGTLWTLAQQPAAGAWGAWTMLGTPGTALAAVAAAGNDDGRLQVFAIDTDGALHTRYQTATGAWSAWGVLAPAASSPTLRGVAAVRDGAGLLTVAGLGVDDVVHVITQRVPDGGWGGWSALPGVAAATVVALGVGPHGPLVFTLAEGFVWWRPADGSGSWQALTGLPGDVVGLAVALDADGTLAVVALTDADVEQTGAWAAAESGTGFGGWAQVGGPWPGGVPTGCALEVDATGVLQLAVTDGATVQVCGRSGGQWGGAWTPLGVPASTGVAALATGPDRSGRLLLFATGTDGSSWQAVQNPVGGGAWSGWLDGWWGWSPLSAPPLLHPPAGTAAAYWGITPDLGLGRGDGTTWTAVAPPAGEEPALVCVGTDGVVWLLTQSLRVFGLVDEVFTELPGGPLADVTSFAAGDATNLWVTTLPATGSGALLRHADGGWQPVPAPPMPTDWSVPQVSVGVDGSVALLDPTGAVWRGGRPDPWTWTARPVGPQQPRPRRWVGLTGTPAGEAWAVDLAGRFWRYAGGWAQVAGTLPGGATCAGLGAAADGTVWALDAQGVAHRFADGAWQVEPGLPPLVAAPTSWAADQRGGLWRYADGAWSPFEHVLPGAPVAQVVTAADGSGWALDTGGGLWSWSDATDTWTAVGGVPAGLTQVAVVSATTMWGLADGAVHQLTGSGWQALPRTPLLDGPTAPVLSAGPGATAWLLDGTGLAWQLGWQPASTWTAQGTAAGLRVVAPDGREGGRGVGWGGAWGVGTDGRLWRLGDGRWAPAGAPLPGDVTAVDVSVGTDGTVWALDGTGRAFTAGPPSTPAAAPVPAAAVADGTGQLHLFGITPDGAVWTGRQRPGEWWSGTVSLGVPAAATAVATAVDTAGALHAFALTADGVAVIGQTAAGAGWGSWTGLGAPDGTDLVGLAAAANADGRLQVFAAGADRRLHTAWESAPGRWSAWGEPSPSDPAVVEVHALRDHAGLQWVLALDDAGGVHAITQTAPDGGWGSWTALGWPAPVTVATLAVSANADGRLQLFAVGGGTDVTGGTDGCGTTGDGGDDGGLYTLYQQADGSWSSWAPLVAPATAVPLTSVVAVAGGSGTLTVAGVGTDGTVHAITQATPDGGWESWAALGAPAGTGAAPLVAAPGPDGPTLVEGAWVASAGAAGWGAWQPVPGPAPLIWSALTGLPPLVQAPVGSAAGFWAVGTDGVPGEGAAGTWTPRPLPGGVAATSVAIGGDGTVRAAATTGGCFAHAGGWELVADAGLARAPVGTHALLRAPARSGQLLVSTDAGRTWWADPGAPARVATVAAAPDGTAWTVDAAGGAAVTTPWVRAIRPTGMPGWPSSTGTAVAAGTDPGGVRYAFLGGPGGTSYSVELYRHAWSEPQPIVSTTLADLRVVRQRDSGALIVHGIDPSGGLVAALGGPDGTFQVTTALAVLGEKPVFDLAEVALVATDAGWTWFAVAGASTGMPGQPLSAAGAPGRTQLDFAPVYAAASELATLVALPWAQEPGTAGVLALDTSGGVHLALVGADGGAADVVGTLSGGALQAPVATIAPVLHADTGAPPQPRIYAVAPASGEQDALWVLRLVDPGLPLTDPAAWSSWIPVGGAYPAPAGGPPLQATDALFSTAGDGSLAVVTQDRDTGRWTDLPVRRPSVAGAEILELSTYQTTVVVQGPGPVPAPGVPVTVSAAEPVQLRVGGNVVRVDAAQPVTVRSDATGRVRLRSLATGLHTPVLTFTAPGLPGPVTVYPPQHVHEFLGFGGQLPVGGGQAVALTPDLVQNATVTDGGTSTPLWTIPAATASSLVQSSTQIAALGGSSPELVADGAPGSWDSFWHGVKHVGEDVVNGVRHGVMAVDDIAVDAAHHVVTITLKVADEVTSVVRLVVRDVASAMLVIEIVWADAIADLEKVIKWLRLLLAWKDFVHTQKVLASLIEQSLSVAGGNLAVAAQRAQGLFTGLEATVTRLFDEAIAALPYSTFADLPSSGPSTTSRAEPGTSIPAPSPVLVEWLLEEVLDHLVPGLDLGTAGLDLDQVLAVVDPTALLDPVRTAVADFFTYVKGVARDPGCFADMSVAELLVQVRDMVVGLLQLLDDLVQALLGLLGEALPGIAGLLRHHLHIPVVADLYRLVTDEDMTLLGVSTLLMAVPVTIVYKIANHGERPFEGIDTTTLRQGPADPCADPGGLPISAKAWAWVYFGLGLIATGLAGATDGLLIAETPNGEQFNNPLTLIGGVADLVTMAQQIASWPAALGGFPDVDIEPLPADQAWAVGNWATGWLPPLVDISMFGLPGMPPSVPLLAATLTGIADMATGATAAALGVRATPPVPGETVAALVLSPAPPSLAWVLLPLLRQPFYDATDELGEGIDTALVKLLVDIGVNVAVPILNLVTVVGGDEDTGRVSQTSTAPGVLGS
ncbi:MAG: hypothetical protein AB7J32_06890 [Pseudonocardia sp.]